MREELHLVGHMDEPKGKYFAYFQSILSYDKFRCENGFFNSISLSEFVEQNLREEREMAGHPEFRGKIGRLIN